MGSVRQAFENQKNAQISYVLDLGAWMEFATVRKQQPLFDASGFICVGSAHMEILIIMSNIANHVVVCFKSPDRPCVQSDRIQASYKMIAVSWWIKFLHDERISVKVQSGIRMLTWNVQALTTHCKCLVCKSLPYVLYISRDIVIARKMTKELWVF